MITTSTFGSSHQKTLFQIGIFLTTQIETYSTTKKSILKFSLDFSPFRKIPFSTPLSSHQLQPRLWSFMYRDHDHKVDLATESHKIEAKICVPE